MTGGSLAQESINTSGQVRLKLNPDDALALYGRGLQNGKWAARRVTKPTLPRQTSLPQGRPVVCWLHRLTDYIHGGRRESSAANNSGSSIGGFHCGWP